MFEQLNLILDFDPTLIAAFAGLSMLVVQMLKSVIPWVEDHAIVANLVMAVFLSTMVVFNITWVLEIALLTFLIMSSAAGVYSTSKKTTVVALPDEEHA